MKNKKIAALLGVHTACGSMAFSLSACGGSDNAASSDKSSTSTSDTAKDTKAADDSSSDDSGAGFEEIQVDEKHSDQEVGPLTVQRRVLPAHRHGTVRHGPQGRRCELPPLRSRHPRQQKGTELGYGKGDFVPDLAINF